MKKFAKRTLAMALALIMIFGASPIGALAELDFSALRDLFTIKAEAATYSGTCGDNLTWTLNTSTGALTISGTGAMTNWSNSSSVPWYSNRSSIKSVTIGSSVTRIGNYAFVGCALEHVVIPDSVTSIGNSAFSDCGSLTSVIIGDGVMSIGRYVFSNCDSLTSITIPDSVTSIGSSAFYCCKSLTSITIPNSVASIEGFVFSGCTSLTNVTIGNGVTSIGEDAFSLCDSLTSIIIPNSVISIGSYAFHNCPSLTSIEIPDSVTSIGNSAFSSCDSLTRVTLGNNVNAIGNYAFEYCSKLVSISIPQNVSKIGTGALKYCKGLKEIKVAANNKFYSSDTNGVLFNKNKTSLIQYPSANETEKYIIPTTVNRIEQMSFYGSDNLTEIVITNSVSVIGVMAFAFCSGLVSITIPESVVLIYEEAFFSCDSLISIQVDSANLSFSSDDVGVLFDKNKTTLIQCPGALTEYTIPVGVEKIGMDAFSNCTKLTKVTIPDSVTTIGEDAFSYCSGLKCVTIGDGLKTVHNWAFKYCDGITDVYYGGTKEQWKKIAIGTYNQGLTNATIHYGSEMPLDLVFTQKHIISDYVNKNDNYSSAYFNGIGSPLDGTNGTPDMCIPGLSKNDDMIPQGITYYKNKNWILISAYASTKSAVANRPSVIYALDFSSGKFVAEFKIFNSDGTAHIDHVGGIGVSGNNLYIATDNSTISYIPLSELAVSVGTSKEIKIEDTFSLSSKLNGAATSYLSISDGYLWTGNFYHTTLEYNKPASTTHNSVVLGFKLSGTGSVAEWNNLTAKAKSDYTFKIPDSITKIQGAAVSLSENKLILTSSYGRKNDSKVYFINIADSDITKSDITSVAGIPMLEGAFILGDYVYTVTESAAWYYNGYDPSDLSKNPTDVVWRIAYKDTKQFYSQTHVIDDYKNLYKKYQTKAYSECFVPMDGTNGNPDFCIPGQGENMIPQGLAYYAAKNWMLVSSYDKKKENASVVFALDFDSGDLVAQFNLYYDEGEGKAPSKCQSHVGGIAVSNYNLYITKGSGIAYVPLSELNVPEGTVKNVLIPKDGKKTLSELGGTNAAHLDFSNGTLWTGNFYYYMGNKTATEIGEALGFLGEKWDVPASKKSESVLLGYKLSGSDSISEWKSIKVSNSDYFISLPKSVNSIQGATLVKMSGDNYKVILSRTTSATFSSAISMANVRLNKKSINLKKSDFVEFFNLPGAENIIVKDGYIYCVYESAALGWDKMKDETDVIWKINPDIATNGACINVFNCPIDIEVYDDGGNLVGRTINNVVDESLFGEKNSVIIEVVDETKYLYLPADSKHKITIIGNGTGKMDYSVIMLDGDIEETERVNFFDVAITPSFNYSGELDLDNDRFDLKNYTLESTGSDINPTEYITDKNKTYAVNVTVVGNGSATESFTATSGDYVTVRVTSTGDNRFAGWYEKDVLVSAESDYSFVLKSNINLTAKFSEKESLRITKMPGKVEYIYKQDKLDVSGIELEVTYTDGTKEIINDTSKMTFSGFSNDKRGEQTVTVEYEGLKASYKVNVKYTWWQWILVIILFGWIWY